MRALAVVAILARLAAAEEALDLPRVGTIGDLPPDPRLVVEVSADATLRLGGKELTFPQLQEEIGAIGLEQALATNLVLRADARVPWGAAFEVMSACGKADLRRMFWAVRPETGEEEGGFAVYYELPAIVVHSAGKKLSLVTVRGSVTPSDAAALHAALRSKTHAALCGPDAVPLGEVLRACDIASRAGVKSVAFLDADERPVTDLKRLVADMRPLGGVPPPILLDLRPLPATKSSVPPVKRVHGGFAGWDEVNWAIGVGGGGAPRREKPSATEEAVELGLAWLAAHQNREDGRWDADGFMDNDPADDKCDGKGNPAYDTGLSALAILAFLGAGYTDQEGLAANRHARAVASGLRYLVGVQDKDGCFGPRTDPRFLYNHAIATLALCEAYWMTRSERLREAAQKGLDFLGSARDAGLAWGYPAGSTNTALTAWCLCAIKSGRYAGLSVDDEAFEGTRLWIGKVTDQETGRVFYEETFRAAAWRPRELLDRFPVEKSEAMTSAGIFCRIMLGEDPRTSEVIRKGAKLVAARPPKWDPEGGSIDFTYWYWGTLATYQTGGQPWFTWDKGMKEALVRHQHRPGTGARTGSWDPLDPFGGEMGRVGSTALLTMCLEVYYRYDRAFGPK